MKFLNEKKLKTAEKVSGKKKKNKPAARKTTKKSQYQTKTP